MGVAGTGAVIAGSADRKDSAGESGGYYLQPHPQAGPDPAAMAIWARGIEDYLFMAEESAKTKEDGSAKAAGKRPVGKPDGERAKPFGSKSGSVEDT